MKWILLLFVFVVGCNTCKCNADGSIEYWGLGGHEIENCRDMCRKGGVARNATF